MSAGLRRRRVGSPARLSRYGARTGAARGFTVVELVLVIVILAIMASIAGPRFFGSTEFSERGYRDELATSLRYAQKVAVATGCPVRVSVGAAGYALNQQQVLAGHCDSADTSFPVPVLLADGRPTTGTTPTGVTVTPSVVFLYDAQGRTDLPADQAIAIGGQGLIVQAASGLVLTP